MDCFSRGCARRAKWKFLYAGLEFHACGKHMEVAEKTSRQARDSKEPIWKQRRVQAAEETQEIAIAG